MDLLASRADKNLRQYLMVFVAVCVCVRETERKRGRERESTVNSGPSKVMKQMVITV